MDGLIKGLIDVALGHNDDRDEERNSESREDRSRSTWAEVVSGEQDNDEPSDMVTIGISGIERNRVMAGMRSGNLVDRGLQCDLIRESSCKVLCQVSSPTAGAHYNQSKHTRGGREGIIHLMDEMMCGQRGWRELAILGDKIEQTSDMVEGLIESPKSGEANGHVDDWPSEEGPHSDFHGPHYGSTACVAIIRNNQLLVANAGDSRCVISRKGQAYNLTRDHKPNLEAENERILKAGGSVRFGRVNGNLNLARAIGDMELKQNKSLPAENQILTANPDVNTVELCDDDEFIVLACDGIWDCMSSQEVVDFVREQLKTETKLSVLCERVFDRCIAPLAGGKGCDNMTMILVQFKKPFGDSVSAKEQPFLWYPDPHSDPDSDSDSDTDEIPTEPEVKE